MDLAAIFSLSSLLVMPFWFLIIFLPFWKVTERVMRSPWVAAAPAVLYLVLVLPAIGEVFPAVLNPSLEGIAALLGTPSGAVIAWAHFLAFDLFVGRWAYLESREIGLRWWLVSPALFFTLMLGPVGFLAYLALRTLKLGINGRAVQPVEPAA